MESALQEMMVKNQQKIFMKKKAFVRRTIKTNSADKTEKDSISEKMESNIPNININVSTI